MTTFDVASNIVFNLSKLLETVYDCSDLATFSVSKESSDILTITTTDPFFCSQHIATIPIVAREMKYFESTVNISIKKLAKSLKKIKNTAIRFLIISGESLLVTPANHPDITIYAEENQYDFVVSSTEQKTTTIEDSAPITLLLADLATMVINLCIGSGFVSFKTKSNRTLSIYTKTYTNYIHVEKLLQCDDVPDFESVFVIKLLKVLTHSSLPPIKTVVCYIPRKEHIPLKFSVAFEKCTLTTLLYDQSKYM